jgi:hemerythrin-like domain-containing protein
MQLRKTDLFTFIHKTIRSLIYNAASKLQTADFTDETEVKNLLASLRHDLDLLHEHAVNEDNIIFPEIADEEPQMIEVLNEEHKKLESKLNGLLVLIEKTEKSNSVEERMLLGNSLNSLFNDFIADYLAHMNHEESTVLEASFKYLTDEELIAIRTRIQSNVPPDRYKVWMNWMLRSLNNTELVGLLSSMKASAPSNVFDYILDATKSVLDSKRWLKMKLSLGI